jgi:hypothetical protein
MAGAAPSEQAGVLTGGRAMGRCTVSAIGLASYGCSWGVLPSGGKLVKRWRVR